jgi:hypothetical protein
MTVLGSMPGRPIEVSIPVGEDRITVTIMVDEEVAA